MDPFLRIEAGRKAPESGPAPRGAEGYVTRRYLAIVAVLALAALIFMMR